MNKSLTREEMRELDRRTIEKYKIPGIILMENAGRNVAEEVIKMINNPEEVKVAVLCGKGNNGGDGFVVARHLHNHGISVCVFLITRISDILKDGDVSTNLHILLNMKIPVIETYDIKGVNNIIKELNNYNLLVDALFGTGLSGDVREPFKTFVNLNPDNSLKLLQILFNVIFENHLEKQSDCTFAWYELRTRGPDSTCLNPIFIPSFLSISNSSSV